MALRLLRRTVAALCLACASAAMSGLVSTGALAQSRQPVVVASKIDTEGALLGEMIALVLEHQGIPVEKRVSLGPTKVVRTALLSGEIDIYPEYTGNGAFFHDIPNDKAWTKAQSAFELVKKLDKEKYNLVWLDRAPANNTWLIAVRGDLARRENLATMEDFARLAKRGGVLKLAGSAEFVESPAALPAFERVYDFKLPRDQIVILPGGDTAVTMRAAAQGVSGVNSAMVYGTDGAIAALDLVVMEDTRGAQIVYEPAPVVRAEVLNRYPAMAQTLSRVFGSLSLNRLQSLNAQIAVEGQPAREVAKSYLEQQGLLP
ncbi:glycine betaine ABC transporter substrate-binding protein OsmF [Microvirga massiliensis]|uniref:glycine betaine ABC transporter substrate-binding protein OsmF n=1 Tax=Microvirga massiliensis TaxID=1033741 RepID=UPI00062B4495